MFECQKSIKIFQKVSTRTAKHLNKFMKQQHKKTTNYHEQIVTNSTIGIKKNA